MAAVFNFLGVLVMTALNATVAQTIYNMVDFGGDPHQALIALCAALVAIVTWATAAWDFGIPTSESHALIAGLSGAAIALHGGLSGINGAEWVKVIYGLVLSTVLGFVLGWLCAKAHRCPLLPRPDRQKTDALLSLGPGGRRRGHGLHARRPGRPEVHGHLHAGHLSGPGPGGRDQSSSSPSG